MTGRPPLSCATNGAIVTAPDYDAHPMGLEAECTVRIGRKTSPGKALLEGDTLIIRGESRLEVPFERMRGVGVEGNELVVRTDDHEVRLELGASVADLWMRLIKEPKGLFEKLEVGLQSRVAVVDVNDSLFVTALRERTASVVEGRVPEGAPVIFFGAETREALRKIALLRARMVATGTLWVIRPKGSKAISEADVFEVLRSTGLVDTKVVAFSKTHTAHKCVIPLELRGLAVRRPPILSIPPSAPVLGAKKGGGNAKATKRPAKKPPPKPAVRSATKAKRAPAKGKKRR
jgi:hypothetical protein